MILFTQKKTGRTEIPSPQRKAIIVYQNTINRRKNDSSTSITWMLIKIYIGTSINIYIFAELYIHLNTNIECLINIHHMAKNIALAK